MVPALFESKPVFWIVSELAKRLGLDQYFNFTLEEYRQEQLKDLPEAKMALKKDGVYYQPARFTVFTRGRSLRPSPRKIETYNQRYADKKSDPMPVYKPPKEVPEGKFEGYVWTQRLHYSRVINQQRPAGRAGP